jgi:hypothetical protein
LLDVSEQCSVRLSAAAAWFDDGGLLADVRRRVAFRTESQERERAPELARYLTEEIGPRRAARVSLDTLGQPRRRRAADVLRRAHRRSGAADRC